jgi:type IV secretory pathway TraG/TraD family ATPase VirD4
LLPTEELERLFEREKRRALVMVAGRKPLILERALYYEDKPFAGMFDEPRLASLARLDISAYTEICSRR